MGCRVTLGVNSTGETAKKMFLVSFTWSLLDRLSELPRRLQKPSSFNGDYIGGMDIRPRADLNLYDIH